MTTKMKKRAFGKGLEDILSIASSDIKALDEDVSASIIFIPLSDIIACRYQSRKDFAEDAISELAASIKSHGVLQPILVRSLGDKYELIAGERRVRASRAIHADVIPAIVMAAADDDVMAFTLIENIQREALNPIEEANGIQLLIEKRNLTHASVAEILGKSRSQTTNLLRLLTLPEPVKMLLRQQHLDMGHARCLLPLEYEQCIEVANTIVEKQLSVRQAEALVRMLSRPEQAEHKTDDALQMKMQDYSQRLESRFMNKCQVVAKKSGGFKVVINIDDLQTINELLDETV